MDTTLIAMSVVNWLHLLATVAWIGGMTVNLFVVLPSAKKALEPPVMGKLMEAVMKRFRILIYLCMIVLVVTGAVMTRFNVSYTGTLEFVNLWGIITLVKHIVVVILIILAIYAFEGLARKVSKLAAKGPSPDLDRLQKKQISFALTGFILGIIILLLTGIMTAISSTS